MGKHLDRVESERVRDQAAGLVRGVASLALAKMHLNISIASLGRGHHIECKDLPELLDAEKALMEACRSLKQFLEAAATFNGSIVLVDFDDGEKVHLSQGSLELAALPCARWRECCAPEHCPAAPIPARTLGQRAWSYRTRLRCPLSDNPKVIPIVGSVLGAILILSALNVNVVSRVLAGVLVAGTVVWKLRR